MFEDVWSGKMNAVHNGIRLINNLSPLFAVFNCKYGDFERFFTLKFIPKWVYVYVWWKLCQVRWHNTITPTKKSNIQWWRYTSVTKIYIYSVIDLEQKYKILIFLLRAILFLYRNIDCTMLLHNNHIAISNTVQFFSWILN